MLKSIAVTLLNRVAFLIALLLIVNAYTRTSCSSGENPFTQIGKAISSLNELSAALQKR